jgi:processive rubber oxygenase RoxA-like protein
MARFPRKLFNCLSGLFIIVLAARVTAGEAGSTTLRFPNDLGISETLSTRPIDEQNAFFQPLGTNDRACISCHQPQDGWTITPSSVRKRFANSDGLDPIFRVNDGAVCPGADVSTLDARGRAYSLLLRKGLIRVALSIPASAEFSLVDVDDPYDCTSGTELALFRRPLPSTNLRFLSAVMWDGRETQPGKTMEENFRQQAIDATLGHAQALAAPTQDQLKQIVDFETALFTAQVRDGDAGLLNAAAALGGAAALSQQPFFIGINDPIGLNPTGAPFDPRAFTMFSAWLRRSGSGDDQQEARRAIARGQELFNTRPITISGVGGLNDTLGLPSIAGTCTLCHDTPNAGNHSVSMPLNIGISDAANRTNDLPLYTLSCNTTGEIVRTSDPGRAMITGKCADIGRVKGPVLRGLAARAPYFHNGSAATLDDVVDFYDRRFALRLTAREKADLVAFLGAL